MGLIESATLTFALIPALFIAATIVSIPIVGIVLLIEKVRGV